MIDDLCLSRNSSHGSLQVSYSTSMSLQWEFQKTPSSVIPLFSVAYAITIGFSVVTCWRLVNRRPAGAPSWFPQLTLQSNSPPGQTT